MSYESNKPYNGINSNQPMYVVPYDQNLKRPGAAEGAMWGAGQTMIGAAAYSGINQFVRSKNPESTSKLSPLLGEVHKTWNNLGNAADEVASGKKGFSSLIRASAVETGKWYTGQPVAGAAYRAQARAGGVELPGHMLEAAGKLRDRATNMSADAVADFVVGPDRSKNFDANGVKTAGQKAKDFTGRSVARGVFGTGWKANAMRIGASAIPGAITGALHNESNGIVGPY